MIASHVVIDNTKKVVRYKSVEDKTNGDDIDNKNESKNRSTKHETKKKSKI